MGPAVLEIPYRKHVLANGLQVVLHEERAAPVVAVYVYYHVGSAREEPGRSGFAHLFEHMLFQGSAHVEVNEHFRRIQGAGGTLNGTTNQDRTNYFETLPSQHLELALWLESDRMGHLLPAMTREKLDNQRDVVMNERRQTYENRPYGLVHETCLAALYPPGHPYRTPTIGSMEDLERASLDDVAAFFRRWYGPNNATLAIGGDVDPAQALELAERWFGPLPRGPEVQPLSPWPVVLDGDRARVLEDDVAQPQLSLVWPTVEAWHPDEPALNLLADALSANRSSLLDRRLILEEELASDVLISHQAGELAGALSIHVRPNEGVSLARLERRVDELIRELARDGVDPGRLERLQTRREGYRVRGLETVAARTNALAFYNCFHGDPGRIGRDLERHRRVRVEDVRRAADAYLVERPRVVLSTVPRGRRDLASRAPDAPPSAPPEPDRRHAPPPSERPAFRSPAVHRRLEPGAPRLLRTREDRVPLVRLAVGLDGGRLRESPARLGLSTLVASLLEEGTRRSDSAALVDELDGLGATLDVSAGDDDVVVRFSVLADRLEEGLDLVEEIVFEPRFDPDDFERVRRKRLLDIATRGDRIRELAADSFARLVFGSGSLLGQPPGGTRETIEPLAVEDARGFWSAALDRLENAWIALVGPGDAAGAERRLARWRERAARAGGGGATAGADRGAPGTAPGAPAGRVYLLDKPGAAQSEIRVGHRGVGQTHPDFFPLQALNHPLGGSFASRINLNLREDKGYTYGAGSAFTGGAEAGVFVVATAVRTADTAAALRELLLELRRARLGFREDEAEFTRRALGQSLLCAYEATSSRLGFLVNLARHGLPDDYPARRLAWLERLTPAALDELAARHLRPDEAVVLVVGDARRVRPDLEAAGLGEVSAVDAYGVPLEAAARTAARPERR